MAHSTPVKRPAKPHKRRGGKAKSKLPFFQHATGRWCKKINGKHRYFGYVKDDPDGSKALEFWVDNKDAILNGVEPVIERADGPSVAEICNQFLVVAEERVAGGGLAKRTFQDYLRVSKRIVAVFGRSAAVSKLTPDDFGRLRANFAKSHKKGLVAFSADIARVKAIFNWAVKNEKLDAPPRYGTRFNKPEDRYIQLARANRGDRIFEPEQLRQLLDGTTIDGEAVAGASQPLRSMILLAINGALGNSDLGRMPLSAVNLDTGWLSFPRQKTGVRRKVPLWPETVESIREWLAMRPKPRDPANAGLMFVTSRGGSFFKEVDDNPISKEFAKLLKRHGMAGTGLTFYRLRHTFRTIASRSKDRDGIEAIMAHKPPKSDMGAAYLARVDESQLLAVVDHVRKWLFPKPRIK